MGLSLEMRVAAYLQNGHPSYHAISTIAKGVGEATYSAVSTACWHLMKEGLIEQAPWRPVAFKWTGGPKEGKTVDSRTDHQRIKFLVQVLEGRNAVHDPRQFFEARSAAESAGFDALINRGWMQLKLKGDRVLYYITHEGFRAAESPGTTAAGKRTKGIRTDRYTEEEALSDLRYKLGSEPRKSIEPEIDNSMAHGSRDICGAHIKSGDRRVEGQRGGIERYGESRQWTCWANKGHRGNHRAYDSSNKDPWNWQAKDGWVVEWAQDSAGRYSGGVRPDNSRVELDRCGARIHDEDDRLRGQRSYMKWGSYWTCFAAEGHSGPHRAYDSSEEDAWGHRVGHHEGWGAEWD